MNAVTAPQALASVPVHDEIDLIELFRSLWAQKVAIIGITLLVGMIGLAYALFATRYYSVQSVLRPAAIKDLDELNHLGIYALSPAQALEKVGAELSSYENRLSFFLANPALFEGLQKEGQSPQQTFESFNDDAFKMLRPDAKQNDQGAAFVGLQLTYPEGIDGAEVMNGFVDYSLQTVRKQIGDDLGTLIENRLNQLDKNIAAARASYQASKDIQIAKLTEADNLKRAQLEDELKALRAQIRTRRDNRIQQLNEAIKIAIALGITKPTTPSALGEAERMLQGSVIRTEVNNQQVPLYFMGSEALEAERKALLQRRSDDFTEPRIAQIDKELRLLEYNRQIELLQSRENEDLFLKDLASWREEAARLRSLSLDTQQLKLVSIDQLAIQPTAPIKPKKVMIVMLALVLGAMLGVFLALIRQLTRRQVPAV
ncbi:LPS O-antigen chain length determinant protein WzzB [Stutzerimonas urumqiensis]|uniref:Wzz/FepE/Etk N-terminal domain-containing protein n=1 Tax=Stutzerimonas urumqiensis TaxID=638269 RepID=UPI003DA6AB68